jgi:hypothetical protein
LRGGVLERSTAGSDLLFDVGLETNVEPWTASACPHSAKNLNAFGMHPFKWNCVDSDGTGDYNCPP